MAKQPKSPKRPRRDPAEVARSRERFKELLAKLASGGISQRELAERTGVAAQQVTDLKKGRRQMSELVVRRIAGEFDLDYRWLLGQQDLCEADPLGGVEPPGQAGGPMTGPVAGEQALRLPVHNAPIDADPVDADYWDGSSLLLIGPAAVAAGRGRRPYVLRMAEDGFRGELTRGDMLLVFQDPGRTQIGDLGVIRSAGRLVLAYRKDETRWHELSTGKPVDCEADIGPCVAVVWATLKGRWAATPDEPRQPVKSMYDWVAQGSRPKRKLNRPTKKRNQ